VVVPVQPLSSAARSGQAWLFQFEGINLVGRHARDRFPGHQPRIGVIGVREGDRLVGI